MLKMRSFVRIRGGMEFWWSVKSLFGMTVMLWALATSCATLALTDPYDDKEDVLVTDVSVEAPSKKTQKHSHHSGKKAKARAVKPKEPRLAQNLPADSSEEPQNLGSGLFDDGSTGGDICIEDLPTCTAEAKELKPAICEVDPAALASNLPPLIAWGASACTAKRLLTAEICRMGFKGIQNRHLHCAPEQQLASCPPHPVLCSPDNRAMVCTAKSYQGKELQFSQFPKTWGVGECRTRYDLRAFACSLKLDPSQLGSITCEPDATAGECPVDQDAVCTSEDDKEREFFVCEAKTYAGKTLAVPLVTYGESRCEAKAALMHMACQYSTSANGLRPSQLEGINCYSELKKTP